MGGLGEGDQVLPSESEDDQLEVADDSELGLALLVDERPVDQIYSDILKQEQADKQKC